MVVSPIPNVEVLVVQRRSVRPLPPVRQVAQAIALPEPGVPQMPPAPLVIVGSDPSQPLQGPVRGLVQVQRESTVGVRVIVPLG